MQYCSLIKLLQSVLLKLIMVLKLDSWYFFLSILWHLLRERKHRPKDIQGLNGHINYQFYSNLRLCQQRIFTTYDPILV